ncbi:MerR family transcriptional regulator [Sporomusa aerivorans]|uniref:MerR family transcriptional regulator n=1 Tax=Sporomusa aerivorans TaxID=204936 RepID=UPI00352ADA63
MLIRELSRKTGASIRSIRYYEAKGLLAAGRLPNGYREYDDDAISRVKTIQFYLSLGLTADNIAGIIACPTLQQSDRPLCKEAYQLYKIKLHEIDEQVNLLHFIRVRLQQRIEAFEQSMESQDSGH